MLDRFTDGARRAIVLAHEEASRLGGGSVGTGHLLLGLLREAEERGAPTPAVDRRAEAPAPETFTPEVKRALELSLRQALQLGHDRIGPEHLVLGLLRLGDGSVGKMLAVVGRNVDSVRAQALGSARRRYGAPPEDDRPVDPLPATLPDDDERRLGQTVQAGAAARALLEQRAADLTDAESHELKRRVAAGEEAERTLLTANQALVLAMATRYEASGAPAADLVEAGTAGLQDALKQFDWRRGMRFSPYASWWIRWSITRSLAHPS